MKNATILWSDDSTEYTLASYAYEKSTSMNTTHPIWNRYQWPYLHYMIMKVIASCSFAIIYKLASVPALRTGGGMSHTIAPSALSCAGGVSRTIVLSALS